MNNKKELQSLIYSLAENAYAKFLEKHIEKYGTLSNCLNICIGEEFGESLNVYVCYRKAEILIKNDVQYREWLVDDKGTRYKTGIVPISLYKNEKVDIHYTIYNFRTKENYKSLSAYYNLRNDSMSDESKIELSSAMYNGQLDKETFNDSLQREVSQSYESFRHIEQPPLHKDRDVNLYEKCLKFIHSDNKESKTMAYALYLSFDSEQTAHANNLVSFLKEHGVAMHHVYNSYAYEILKRMQDSLDIFTLYPLCALRHFDLDSETCKKIVYKGMKSMQRKIARVFYESTISKHRKWPIKTKRLNKFR